MDFSKSDLYDFQSKNGIVLPQTSSVRTAVENMFKDIFGADISLEPETVIGRMVEAITLMFVNMLGVNAQNANALNPDSASGDALDMLGSSFGIPRLDGESDASFRNRIKNSQSRGSGFAESIRQAIANCDSGITSICVLNNGNADPAVFNGISVAGHSVFIAVAGGDEENIAKAIYDTISCGCGIDHSSEFGTIEDVEVPNVTGGTTHIYFVRPSAVNVKFRVSVKNILYTGNDIETSVKSSILKYIAANASNASITKGEVSSAISGSGEGIIVSSIVMQHGTETIDDILIRPNEYASVSESDIEVEVA